MTTQPKPGTSRSEEVVRKHKEYLWPAVVNYYAKPLVADRGEMQYRNLGIGQLLVAHGPIRGAEIDSA